MFNALGLTLRCSFDILLVLGSHFGNDFWDWSPVGYRSCLKLPAGHLLPPSLPEHFVWPVLMQTMKLCPIRKAHHYFQVWPTQP